MPQIESIKCADVNVAKSGTYSKSKIKWKFGQQFSKQAAPNPQNEGFVQLYANQSVSLLHLLLSMNRSQISRG